MTMNSVGVQIFQKKVISGMTCYGYKRVSSIVLVLFLFAVSVVVGQSHLEGKPDTYLDPESIDLTKPTIFAIPYSHLDDQWRLWSQQISRFVLNLTVGGMFYRKNPDL